MTRITSGNSGGGTFRIDNTAREIGLTQRGIIIATSEGRVFDWVYDYIKPYESIRYAMRYARTEDDLFSLVTKPRTVLSFIEAGFFGEKAPGGLKGILRENPKLRVILFSVSARPPEDAKPYLWWGADSFISLREDPERVRYQMKTVFDGCERMSERALNRAGEHNRLSGIPPLLTVQEVAVCRYAAKEKERKEIAACLGICVKTVDNHLVSIRRKFRKCNMVGILRVAVSMGILSPEELACRDFDYSILPLTDHTC
jgi:DNA-binding NarL/FixJ family response regulator